MCLLQDHGRVSDKYVGISGQEGKPRKYQASVTVEAADEIENKDDEFTDSKSYSFHGGERRSHAGTARNLEETPDRAHDSRDK
jgi:hypothetical protein